MAKEDETDLARYRWLLERLTKGEVFIELFGTYSQSWAWQTISCPEDVSIIDEAIARGEK